MRNGYRALCKTIPNVKLFCMTLAEMEEDLLFVRRVDRHAWERNRRNGTVEITYSFDKDKTSKLSALLQAQTTTDLFKQLKSRFGFRTVCLGFIQNMQDYCSANNIAYHYSFWY